MTILASDFLGIHKTAENKDYKVLVSGFVSYLNEPGVLSHTTIQDLGNGTYSFTTADGSLTVTISQNATDIDISDAGNLFTSTDVEGALQEVGQSLADIETNKVPVYDNAGTLLGYLLGP